MTSMIIVQCSDNQISSTNRVSGNDNKHIFIEHNGTKYPITMISKEMTKEMTKGMTKGMNYDLGLSETLRKWIYVPLKTEIKINPIDR